MRLIFDMDGTVANLYSYPNWLELLRAYDAKPYREAKPMWDMKKLVNVLNLCRRNGITIVICSWLSKKSTKEYNHETRQAKREWLNDFNFPYDEIHLVKYGTPKHKYRSPKEKNILIDDNKEIREAFSKFNNCSAVDPAETDIVEWLERMIAE